MSVRVIQWVFERSKSKGSARLVALALADHAGNDGIAFPSWARIAYYTKLSRAAIATAVKQLVNAGEIEVQSGASKSKVNIYRFSKLPQDVVDAVAARRLPTVQNLDASKGEGSKIWTPGVQNLDPRGSKSGHGSVIEPSKNRKSFREPRKGHPGAFYKMVEDAFAEAYLERKKEPWLYTAPASGRARLKVLFDAGQTPEQVAEIAREYVLNKADSYRAFTIESFVRFYNDIGTTDRREEKHAAAAYDAGRI